MTKNFASGFHLMSATADSDRYLLFIIYLSTYLYVKECAPVKYLIYSSYLYKSLKYNFKAMCLLNLYTVKRVLVQCIVQKSMYKYIQQDLDKLQYCIIVLYVVPNP
jgi:hypothetical protein